jgi:hypothetical protein
MNPLPVRSLRVLFQLTTIAVLVAGCGKGSTPPAPANLASNQQGPPAKEAVKAPPADPAETVTAEQIGKDFLKDKEAAKKKYMDKVWVIDGVVEDGYSVRGENVINPNVVLFGYKPPNDKDFNFINLQCFLTEAASEKIGGLTKGQKVKLKGKCRDTFSFLVQFGECEVLEAGPDPVIRVSAVDITKDFASDAKAAGSKYHGKPVLIEGVVAGKEDKMASIIVLEGFDEKAAKPVRVHAGIAGGNTEAFRKVTKGQKIKIKGECSDTSDNKEVAVNYGVIQK